MNKIFIKRSFLNEKIKNYGKKCGLTSGVGTTVTAILITEKKYL